MDRNETIKTIKTALKARGLNYSVTGGRGTAWGWITIDLLPSVSKLFTPDRRRDEYVKMVLSLGLPREWGYTAVSIPAGSDYYREYIERAEGKTPSKLGTPYWD